MLGGNTVPNNYCIAFCQQRHRFPDTRSHAGMESTKKVTLKQLNSLQEKSKIYLAGAGRGNTKVGGHAHAYYDRMD